MQEVANALDHLGGHAGLRQPRDFGRDAAVVLAV